MYSIDPSTPTNYTRLQMNPGEELVQELDLLRQRLNKSKVEATNGLRDALGNNCTFFRKSMDKFVQNDYEDIKDRINQIQTLFNLIEGSQ